MLLRLYGIEVNYDADQQKELSKAIRRRLDFCASSLQEFRISRRSIDARRRPVQIVYSVDVLLKNDVDVSVIQKAIIAPNKEPLRTETGTVPLSNPPVIVGGGPAGLFAALFLAEHGFCPVLIERGGTTEERQTALHKFVTTRSPDPECNALFGLGGAGTFSDGKLSTGVNHPWIKGVLDILEECGAPKQITYDAKPHVGTDILKHVVTNLVSRIVKAGGTVYTNVRMNSLCIGEDHICGLDTTMGKIACETAVLAIGHSARDTWSSLNNSGVLLEPKPFQIGIRAEHPQEWLDRHRYGNAAGHPLLGAADYKLATKVNGTSVFSFCMCPGGETMPTVNEKGYLAINGMSMSRRNSPFSSSGLVVTLFPEVYGGNNLESCLTFQRSIEKTCFEAGGGDYSAPAQRLTDFYNGIKSQSLPSVSYKPEVCSVNLAEILPTCIAIPLRKALEAFDKTIPGYLHKEAAALAPESRASSPIRIVRDSETMQAKGICGLYPAGEGAGYAGGIMSSALDGLNAARKIAETYAPCK